MSKKCSPRMRKCCSGGSQRWVSVRGGVCQLPRVGQHTIFCLLRWGCLLKKCVKKMKDLNSSRCICQNVICRSATSEQNDSAGYKHYLAASAVDKYWNFSDRVVWDKYDWSSQWPNLAFLRRDPGRRSAINQTKQWPFLFPVYKWG